MSGVRKVVVVGAASSALSLHGNWLRTAAMSPSWMRKSRAVDRAPAMAMAHGELATAGSGSGSGAGTVAAGAGLSHGPARPVHHPLVPSPRTGVMAGKVPFGGLQR